jgi:hypothetical protein
LPFGKGHQYLNQNAVVDAIVGGWSANAMFVAQTGNYFTVNPTGINTASGGSNTRAVKVGNPYSTGGTSAVGGSCPTSVRNYHNWYNPCAFTNPWDPGSVSGGHYLAPGSYVTDTADVIGYLGGKRTTVAGPGYERVNMSVFKSFSTYREQSLEFRTDIFNLFNTPALANPSNSGIGSTGGQITGTRSLQRYSPDSRFFQMSLKYSF